MKNENKNKILLYISFIVVLLLILLRFGISYLKSDGFNGLSIQIPILLFALFFCIVYLCSFCRMGISGLQKARRRPCTMGNCSFYSYTLYRIANLFSAPSRN